MLFPILNATTRPFLSKLDIDNRWIWKSCKHLINVSQKDQEKDIVDAIIDRGATYTWIPMGENEELDLHLICQAMNVLLSFEGEETIVHCDCGNNRSRLVCEFAIYAKTGRWPLDELSVGLDGCNNKTVYNIKHGFLPCLDVVEKAISDMKLM